MKLISFDDKKWIVVAIIETSRVEDPKQEKEKWNADIILRKGSSYYFCKEVLDAEFEEIN